MSRTITHPEWEPTIVIGSEVETRLAQLKREVDGAIVVFGSGDLIRTLAAHDLVDTYQLLVFPVVLGHGKRMFAEGTAPTELVLTYTEASASGVVINTYARTEPS